MDEFCLTLRQYRITKVHGDRYAGEWPREQFQKRGIHYQPAEHSKSDLYVQFLPLLNSRKVSLLDHPRAITQLCSLERRTGRGTGKDVIDHPSGLHDDIANAIAGACVMAASRPPMHIDPSVLARSAQIGRVGMPMRSRLGGDYQQEASHELRMLQQRAMSRGWR